MNVKDRKKIIERINKEIKYSSNYDTVIKEFEKISDLCSELNCFLDSDIYIQLVKTNEIIGKMVKVIVDQNIDLIKQGQIDDRFDNDIIISFIEAYCITEGLGLISSDYILDKMYDDLIKNKNIYNCHTDYNYKAFLLSLPKQQLNEQEERNLLELASKGDRNARHRLIEKNMLLVAKVAFKYTNRGLDILDLIQEGSFGLMKAIDTFDLNKQTRLSTYAFYWIRQRILSAIKEKGGIIRIPTYIIDNWLSYEKTKNELESSLFRNATLEEIATAMGISVEKALEIAKFKKYIVSLNSPVIEDVFNEFISLVDQNGKTLEEQFINLDLPNQILKLFDDCKLNEQEKKVLIKRYNLDGEGVFTLEAMSGILEVSKERVRQIEARAIRKIRGSKYIKEFACYMDNPNEALKNLSLDRRNLYTNKGCSHVYNEKSDATNRNSSVKLLSIYEYLNSRNKKYSKEQIDLVISTLDDFDKALLTLRYGENFENQVMSEDWNDVLNDKFYSKVLPKLKRKLDNPSSKIYKKNTIDLENILKSNDTTLDNRPIRIEKEDYKEMLDLLKSPTFEQMTDYFTPKEKMAVALKLGCVNSKVFDTSSITNFLEISEEEVRNATKKALLMYKEDFDCYLEKFQTNNIQKEIKVKKLQRATF